MLSQVYMFFLTIFNIIILLQYFCFPPWIPFQLLPSNLLQIHNLFSVIVSECINTHIHIVCIMLIVCMFSKLTIWDWTTNLCAVLRRRPPLNIWESCVIVGFDWIRKQLQNFTAASSPFYSHFYNILFEEKWLQHIDFELLCKSNLFLFPCLLIWQTVMPILYL